MATKLASFEHLPPELRRSIQDYLILQDVVRLLQCSKAIRKVWESDVYGLNLVQDHCMVRACETGNIALYRLLILYGAHPLKIYLGWGDRVRPLKKRSEGPKYTDVESDICHAPYLQIATRTSRMTVPAYSTLDLAIQYSQLAFYQYCLARGALNMFQYSGISITFEDTLTKASNAAFLGTLIVSEPHNRLVKFFSLTRFPVATLILGGASAALIEELISIAPSPEAVIASRTKAIKVCQVNCNNPRHGSLQRAHLQYSPVQAAMIAGNPEILALLLKHNAEFPDSILQERLCIRHEPRTPFYFCATTKRYDQMAATFDICKAQGANINEISYWPVVHESDIHNIIMTPLFEYIFSLPLDIWTLDESSQVVEVVKLFVKSGALLDPTSDKKVMELSAVNSNSCSRNWFIQFVLARWGHAMLNETGFYSLIEFLFQNGAAEQFVPSIGDNRSFISNLLQYLDGSIKLMDLTMQYSAPFFSRFQLRSLLESVKHLQTWDHIKEPKLLDFEQENRAKLRDWTGRIQRLMVKASKGDTAAVGLCNTCMSLARLNMRDAQIRQAYLWGHREYKSPVNDEIMEPHDKSGFRTRFLPWTGCLTSGRTCVKNQCIIEDL